MATYVALDNPFTGTLPMNINYNTAYRFQPGSWKIGWRGVLEFTFTPDEEFPVMWICSVLMADYSINSAIIETIGSSRKYVLDFADATADITYIQFYAGSEFSGNCVLGALNFPPSTFWTSFNGQSEIV